MLKFAIAPMAGGVGMTNTSAILRKVSRARFALFFIIFLALLAFAHLLGMAFNGGQHSMLEIAILTV